MVEKFIDIDGLKIHYIDNDVSSKKIVFIFPPGIEDARFIEHFSPDEMKFRTIAITYPSRYKSDPLGDGEDSSDKIAQYTAKLVDKLSEGYQKIHLIGFSFGTMIITKILQQHLEVLGKSKAKMLDVILINAGEFMPDNLVPTFEKVFAPLQENDTLRELTRKVVAKIPIIKDNQLNTENSKNLNAQWLDVLDYRIDMDKKVSIPTIFIIGDQDLVIKSGSMEKLSQVFTNREFMFYGGGHIVDYHTDKNTPKVIDQVKELLIKS